MGEAKRRKKQDPKWGTPIVYELKLRDRTSLLFEIPFTVPRLPTQLEVRRRAKAIGILVMSLLQEPIAANRDRSSPKSCSVQGFLRSCPFSGQLLVLCAIDRTSTSSQPTIKL